MANLPDPNRVKTSFDHFSTQFNFEQSKKVWEQQSSIFKEFWEKKILNPSSQLSQEDTDRIIRLIDTRARGHEADDQAIARVGIYQGVWERLFSQLREKENIRNTLDKIFQTENDEELIGLINDLVEENEGNANGLNGQQANAINSLLFLNNPSKFISSVSLAHRGRIMEVFGFGILDGYKTVGEKIIYSNRTIVDGFRNTYGIITDSRAISVFLYTGAKAFWHSKAEDAGENRVIKIQPLILEKLAPKVDKPRNKTRRPVVFDLEKNIDQQREQSFQGYQAEQLVMDEERLALEKGGRTDLADKIRLISEEDSGAGYDILSYTLTGEEKHIEVKSTVGGIKHNQFHISRRELEWSTEDSNYYLYIVYDVEGSPKIRYLHQPDLRDPELFDLEPLQYLVKYKAKT